MPRGLGIDVGSTAVKAAIVDEGGGLAGAWTRPITGRPAEAVAALLLDVAAAAGPGAVRVGITGSGSDLIHGAAYREDETVALARAIPLICPGARTAIEIGGQSARLVVIEPGTRALLDYGLNQQCAAGSGSFIEQQAGRLGLDTEEFARLAAGAPRGATVAGRCSVFAKSDMIHLQQKGTPVADIAYGLCLAVARNFMATVIHGREIPAPMVLAGGGARNPGLVRAFAEVLGIAPGSIVASPHPGAECAVGMAVAAMERDPGPETDLAGVARALDLREPEGRGSALAALQVGPIPDGRAARTTETKLRPGEGCFLGADVGSVSTNLVVMAEDGSVAQGIYLPTRGRPIEALGRCLDLVSEKSGGEIAVRGVAVTGSGRHLAARLLGADLVKNEITCQLRGAVEVDPEVDTIFEIGGQDSKYIQVRGGRIADFVMNKICAAGTGSFLEEQAEHLGVAIVDEFSRLAARSARPADLGCQCTVFMHSEVVSALRRGASREDLCAGLAYSVARNYLDRVVARRPVGRRVIFQGGVAQNPSVVAAFARILGVPVRVHPDAGLSGAIGAALLAREARPARTLFRGLGACRDHEVKSFECESCENRCQVSRITIEGAKVHFGDACEKYSSRVAGGAPGDAPDMAAIWREMEQPYLVRPDSPRGRIGIPRASTLIDQMPFWHAFFASLGYEVVTSGPSSQATLLAGLRKLPAETCLPIKLTFGHVHALEAAGVDHVFLPSILTQPGEDPRLSHSCPYVQAVPYMARAAMSAKFLSPEVDLSGGRDAFVRGMASTMQVLDVEGLDLADAYEEGMAAWDGFRARLIEAGKLALGGARRAIVVVGKPYNVLDPFLNLNLMKHLMRLGETAIPMWCLPIGDEKLDKRAGSLPWHMNRNILRAVSYCGRDERLFPVMVSNFGCGPDAFMHMHLEQILGGRHALALEFDEHRAEAGLVTRLEAFVDEIDAAGREAGGRAPEAAPPRVGRVEATEGKAPAARRSFVVPYFSDHAFVFAGALRAAGYDARVLPLPSEEIRRLGEATTSGKECHPYSLLTGDLVHLARSRRKGGEIFFFPGTTIPCLLHQYGEGHRLLLERMGVRDLTVVTPGLSELKDLLGLDIGARMWRGLVAVDLLLKMVCEIRPYELEPGQTDEMHRQNLKDVEVAIATDQISAALTMITSRLRLVRVDRSRPRPLVGVAGDIFTRTNPVGNQDLFTWLEARGCEVWPAPFLVDITDFSLRRHWDKGSLGDAALLGALMLRKDVESWRVRRLFRGKVKRADEPGYQEVLDMARPYLGEQQNEALVLNVAKMVDFARRGAAGILNAVCFNCMLGTVSTAITGRIREAHAGLPITSLVYSAVEGSQRSMLEAFLHQVRDYAKKRAEVAALPKRPESLLSRLWPGG